MSNKLTAVENLGQSIQLIGEAVKHIGEAVEKINTVPTPIQEAKVETKKPDKEVPAKESPQVEEEESDVEYTETDLKALKVKELKEILDEEGIEYKVKASKAELIDLILGASDEDEEDIDEEDEEVVEDDEEVDEDDEDEEDDEEEDEEDLEEMSLKELKAYAKELGIKVSKKVKKAELIELIEDELYEDEDEDEEDEDNEEETVESIIADYGLDDKDEYSTADLKEMLEDAGLSTKGKRQALEHRVAQALIDGDIETE